MRLHSHTRCRSWVRTQTGEKVASLADPRGANCAQIYWLDFIREADGIAELFNKASDADEVRDGFAIYTSAAFIHGS